MNTTIKVTLACFIGSALGIFTMLESNPKFWPVGLIVGFFGGYLSYEFKKVLKTLPVAWKHAISWEPNKECWKYGFLSFWAMLGMNITITIPFGVLFWITRSDRSFLEDDISSFIGISIAVAFLGAISMGNGWRDDPEKNRRELGKFWKINPFRIYIWFLLVGLWWFVRHIPVVLEFTWHLFKMIHSEERLLCGVDAAIGVAVCHYSGNNILLGVGVGVLWGVLNFEVLSIRVLKLVPATASIFHRP